MGSPSIRTLIRPVKRRFGLLTALAVLCVTVAPYVVRAAAADRPPAVLRLSVQGPDGNFFPHGEVELCLHGGDCLYADIDRGYPGQFSVPKAKLVPDGLYQVLVYDPDVDVVYEMRNWRYVAKDHDAGYDVRLGVEKFSIYARFRGNAGGGLDFEIANTLNPEWEKRAGMAPTGPDSLPDFPRMAGRVTALFPYGDHYREDPEAAGGVLAVDVGLGVAMSWRSHLPTSVDATKRRLPFREFTLAWDGNLYTTAEVLTPGRSSDVMFHRLTVAYGVGRSTPAGETQFSLSLVAGYGAVMDGTEVLSYVGRDYRMFGAGARLVYIRQVAAGRGARLGLCGVIEALHWWADPVGDDHWHGLAPSAALGVAFF
jgi:hypothetical protein